ncbi:MAG TPA: methyl-accepting chemotaxis protein [Bryobacteraceae bacterium]
MKLTLGSKISLACGVPIVLALAFGLVSIQKMGRLGSIFQAVDSASLPATIRLAKLSRAAAEEEKEMLKYVLAAGSPNLQAQCETNLAAWERRFQSELESDRGNPADVGASQAFARIRQAHQGVLDEWRGTIRPLSRDHAQAAFAKWLAEMIPAVHAERQAIAAEIESSRQDSRQKAAEAAAISQSVRFWAILLLILVVAGGSGFAFALIRSVHRVLVRVAADLGRGAEQVASAAGQISSSSQSLAQGTSEQAASLEETSASTEEMTSMTRKNAENAESCARLMAEVDTRIAEANQTLEEMVGSMEQISASSDKISKIIKVIEEIAFQTNILALNAAVEAARAGEAGMGFAVVADEVRSLAQRSSQAAKDTAVLIEESIASANDGTAKVSRVAGAIEVITRSADKVKLLVDEVNIGSQEQARGMAQIAKAVVEIEQVTQRAAAGSEQTASASQQLSAQAETMRKSIEGVWQLAGGGSGQTRTAHRRILPAPEEPMRFQPVLAAREQIPLEDDFKEF